MTQLVIHPPEQTPDASSRPYGPIIVGVTLTVLALHMVVTRPLLKKVDSLNRQVVAMQANLDAVAGSQADAWRTNDLLTALTIQAERLDSADLALGRFDSLATRLDALDAKVIAMSRVMDDAFSVVGQFETLHDRLTAAAGDADSVRRDLADIELVTERIDALASQTSKQRDALDVLDLQSSELAAIAGRLAMETETASVANKTLDKLSAMNAKLVATETRKATETANQLITIAGRIEKDGSSLLQPANKVLAGLRQATGHLDTQGERLETLISSAEVLEDFEAELARHIQGLESVRRELVDFAMMETTLNRVASTLEPLTELARLRRLQPQDLQVVVDGMRRDRLNRDAGKTMISTKAGEKVEEPLRTADRLVPEPTQVIR